MSIIVKKAIFVTLIVLLILAGVSLSGLFSEKGLFKRTENASNRYNEAKAREVLETVLLADGQYEKNTNPEYNQDDFLDDLIKSEIPGSDIKGDVAIIGKYAYELDRSVPKIGRYLGNASDLVFPTVTASEPILADDYRTATFRVTAIEEKNGINKIEIWFAGEKIEALTKTYDNVKTEIKENFTVNRNGKYTIKAYGDLMASTTVEVTGIVPAVEFSPNGSNEWKKEHTTKIIVKETGERVTSLKYKWTTSGVNEPQISEFTETCPADNVIIGKDFTGTYYLWILLTTETGKTNICGSEGFNFDNQKPTVSVETKPLTSISFSIIANCQDNHSGVVKCLAIINGIEYTLTKNDENTYSLNWTGTEMTESQPYTLKVVDFSENFTEITGEERTLLYTWNKYEALHEEQWETVHGTEVHSKSAYDVSGRVGNPKAVGYNVWYGQVGGSLSTGSGYICGSWSGTTIHGLRYYYNCKLISGKYYWQEVDCTTRRTLDEWSNSNTFIEPVYSTKENAYPEDDHVDNYWYVANGLG